MLLFVGPANYLSFYVGKYLIRQILCVFDNRLVGVFFSSLHSFSWGENKDS